MATYLPGSGAISISDINGLFGRGNNLNSYRGTTYYTSTAGPFSFSSGAIDMNGFHGTGPTANRVAISYTFSSNTADASLNVTSIGGYVAGTTDITVTVNSGIYLWASSTGNAGLTLTGGTSGDTLTIVNNGYIMGCGGVGTGFTTVNLYPGIGGTALSLGFNATINNTNGSAYIGGGGGGGGGTDGASGAESGGGGAGGGVGGAYQAQAGGTGGSIGGSGGNGSASAGAASSGGGGRVFPGTGGAGGVGSTNKTAYAGSGGTAGGGGASYANSGSSTAGNGGSGSSAGVNGVVNAGSGNAGGGGGGWGASGGTGRNNITSTTYPGAFGGKAVALNGYSVSWVSGDTTRVYGAVS